MIHKFQKFSFALLAALLLLPLSCVDLDFDQPPPGGEDPNLPVNITIAELKAIHEIGEYEEITEDWTFSGLVISDDEEGNFFKQLVIADSTGGIEMRIEMTDLHNVYAVGRKVYVKAKGLWLGDYNGLIQLGAGVETLDGESELIRIPESLVDQYIVTATYGNPVTPKTLTFNQLTESDVSTLVRFENVQYVTSDLGKQYADIALDRAGNRGLEDCERRRIIVRTSQFASFGPDMLPSTNGTVVGVLGIFNGDYQLTIRDLEDVNMTAERCGSVALTIDAIRDLYTGSPTTVPSGSIRGVVISDFSSGSVQSQNLYIQDATGGIVLRFGDSHSFALGTEILVDISGGELDEFNGLLQIENLSLSGAIFAGMPGDVTPRDATVLEVLTNAQAWESTLVRITDATLSGNSVFNGSITVTDASGGMVMFTRSQANFAQTTLPSGLVTVTAIVSEFNTPQLIIRNANDVTGGGGGGGDEFDIAEIRQMFAGGMTSGPAGTIQGVVISDYTSMSVTGRNLYIQDATGGIVLRFADNHSFTLGSEIRVNVSGAAMSEFNGLLQLDGISLASASMIGNPGDVSPRQTSVQALLANLEAWESTLVEISNVTLTGNTVYNGSVTVTDASGSIVLFTRAQSTFAQEALPAMPVTITAIVSQFTDPQIIIRNSSDVSGGGGGTNDLDEDFTGLSDNVDINLPGWANIAVKGTRKWRSQVDGDNTFAQATSFNDQANEMEAWLITPSIELDEAKKLTFESAYGFFVHNGLSVWISSNFNGTDVTGATWQQLFPTLAMSSDTEFAFIPSGNINLSGFSGTVRIGFKYTGSGPGGLTTSWLVDKVKVENL